MNKQVLGEVETGRPSLTAEAACNATIDAYPSVPDPVFCRLIEEAGRRGGKAVHDVMEVWRQNPHFRAVKTDMSRRGDPRYKRPMACDLVEGFTVDDLRQQANFLASRGWDVETITVCTGLEPKSRSGGE